MRGCLPAVVFGQYPPSPFGPDDGVANSLPRRCRRRKAADPSTTASAAPSQANRRGRSTAAAVWGPLARRRDIRRRRLSSQVATRRSTSHSPKRSAPAKLRRARLLPLLLPHPTTFTAGPSPSSCRTFGRALQLLVAGTRQRRLPEATTPGPSRVGRTRSLRKFAAGASCGYVSAAPRQERRESIFPRPGLAGERAGDATMDVDIPDDTILRKPHRRRTPSAIITWGAPDASPPNLADGHAEADLPSGLFDATHYERMTLLRREAYDDLARSTRTYDQSLVRRMRYLEGLTWDEQRSALRVSDVGCTGGGSKSQVENGLAVAHADLGGEEDPDMAELVAKISGDPAAIKDFAELLAFEDGLVKHDPDQAHWVGDLW